MIIPRPSTDLTIDEPNPFVPKSHITKEQADYLFSLPPWKCPTCGCRVFATCKSCPYCKFKLGKETLRP